MANEENAVKKSVKDSTTDERLNDQAFLLFQYRKLIGTNLSKNYANFIQLNGQPGTLLSKLLGTGVENFFSITTAQLSVLQPKIRLYKTFLHKNGKETDIEIPFNELSDNLRLEDVVKNRDQRGSAAAIKSFEWEDAGTNPGESGKVLSVTLVMVFSTLEDIFREFGNEKISYSDLIRQTSPRSIYDEPSFRIKAIVGWQLPGNFIANELFDSETLKALENSQVIMNLALTTHEIEVSETGQTKLTVNYIGAIEAYMLSPETDILYTDNNLSSKLKSLDRRIKLNERSIQLLDEEENKPDSFQGQKDLFDASKNEYLLRKESLIRENRIQRYGSLLNFINSDKRIFFIDIDSADIIAFEDLKKEKFETNIPPDILEKTKIDRLKNYRNKIKEVSFSQDKNFAGNPNVINVEDIKAIESSKSSEERDKLVKEISKRYSSSKTQKSNKKHRINFVYFGDLIDAALKTLFSNEKNTLDSAKINATKNFRFVLGTVEFGALSDKFGNSNLKPVTVSLADIPISLDLFNIWFLKRVIGRSLEKYFLRDFLTEICSDLIVKALSPECFGDFTRAIKNRVDFSVFSLKNTQSNPLRERGNLRLHIDEISKKENLRTSINSESSLQYLMMYVTSAGSANISGDFEKDRSAGIPHFFVGANKGVLKKILFKRVDMPYWKENRIVNSYDTKNTDIFFSEPYNAELILIGTPHLKPGMMIYIDPNSIASPKSITKKRAIPLGGYYTVIKSFSKIESGKFETTINANFMSSGEFQHQEAFSSKRENNTKSIDSVK